MAGEQDTAVSEGPADTGKPSTAKRTPAVNDEPTFSRSRLLSFGEGEEITGLPHPVLVGALHGRDRDSEFTRSQVRDLADDYLARPVGT